MFRSNLIKVKYGLFSNAINGFILGGTTLSVKLKTYSKSSATTVGMELLGTSEPTAKVTI